MPQITFTLNTDNAAFDDDHEGAIYDAFAKAAKRAARSGGAVLDVNGNKVGSVNIGPARKAA